LSPRIAAVRKGRADGIKRSPRIRRAREVRTSTKHGISRKTSAESIYVVATASSTMATTDIPVVPVAPGIAAITIILTMPVVVRLLNAVIEPNVKPFAESVYKTRVIRATTVIHTTIIHRISLFLLAYLSFFRSLILYCMFTQEKECKKINAFFALIFYLIRLLIYD
jgi:hypothetical protein